MRRLHVALLLLASSPFSFAAAKDAPPQDPIAWGILSHNSGCVIFAEGHKTKGMFWGVAVTEKITGKLTVIETQNYTLDKKEYLETQDEMNGLMRRAQNDHVKFVKIQEKYSPELLEKARVMCKSDV
jgi:Spy/CpxP family protein refolding chaperone